MSDYAKEGGHWYYTKTGLPAYEMPNKSKPGEFRNTTKADYKKLLKSDTPIAPSVSGIVKLLEKPALNIWKENQILESAYTCPVGRNEVDGKEWIDRVRADAKEQAITAAEKGNIKHAQIENYFKAQILPVDGETINQIKTINEVLIGYGISGIDDIEPEKSFACDRFGGKMDLPAISKNFIADIKTTEFTLVDGIPHKKGKKDKLWYPEQGIQLCGYAMGNNLVSPILINIYVSTLDDSIFVHEWGNADIGKYMDIFDKLTDIWYLML